VFDLAEVHWSEIECTPRPTQTRSAAQNKDIDINFYALQQFCTHYSKDKP
jgi:hypothetical protein